MADIDSGDLPDRGWAILTLPGNMETAQKHPDAEAVRTMGVLDFRAVVPRLQAFIWALKPTDKVDIRRLPREERAFTEREIARLCLRSA